MGIWVGGGYTPQKSRAMFNATLVLGGLSLLSFFGSEYFNDQYRQKHRDDAVAFKKLQNNKIEITDKRYVEAPFCLSNVALGRNKERVDTAQMVDGEPLELHPDIYGDMPLGVELLDNKTAVLIRYNHHSNCPPHCDTLNYKVTSGLTDKASL